jgi:hypothetical protein
MIARRMVACVAAACLVCLMSDRALALWMVAPVSPDNAKDAGFEVTAESTDGTTTIVISRHVADQGARDGDSDAKTRRFAQLNVSGTAGQAVECQVEPTREGEYLKYRVRLARKLLPPAKFSIFESTPPDPSQIHIIDPRLVGGARVIMIGGDTHFLEGLSALLFGADAAAGADKTDAKGLTALEMKEGIGWTRVIYEFDLNQFVGK